MEKYMKEYAEQCQANTEETVITNFWIFYFNQFLYMNLLINQIYNFI